MGKTTSRTKNAKTALFFIIRDIDSRARIRSFRRHYARANGTHYPEISEALSCERETTMEELEEAAKRQKG